VDLIAAGELGASNANDKSDFAVKYKRKWAMRIEKHD